MNRPQHEAPIRYCERHLWNLDHVIDDHFYWKCVKCPERVLVRARDRMDAALKVAQL